MRKLNVTDRQTDRQTDGGHCYISRPGPGPAPLEIKTCIAFLGWYISFCKIDKSPAKVSGVQVIKWLRDVHL